MKFEIKKGERENNQSLVRRFTRRLRNSGILPAARDARFRKRNRSDQAKKKAALRKLEKQAEYEEQKKLGDI